MPQSSSRRRHRMRCSKCGTRFALKRHPDAYKRTPRCPCCKSLHIYSTEASRRREVERQQTCCCPLYPFPHRAGSLRFCVNHPSFGETPTQSDYDTLVRITETPRGTWR